jgi:ADP-ribosylglycohydrolase
MAYTGKDKLESTDFENTARPDVSLGVGGDTIACIADGIAEACYQTVPDYIIKHVLAILPQELMKIIEEVSMKYRK